jgi:hypothetical protein
VAYVAVGLSLMLALTFADRTHAQSSPVQTAIPAFQASLDRIASRSPLWRDALTTIAASNRRIIIVTPEQVRRIDSERGGVDRFDETLLAETTPIAAADSRVDTVIVVINLALLEERYRERKLLPIELDMDLDRIVIHEVYGHAIPYLVVGNLSGRCADPQPRERAVDACSIRRENAVRAELGLGRRVDYGLDGLNLTRRH